jgi:hypothetical protein
MARAVAAREIADPGVAAVTAAYADGLGGRGSGSSSSSASSSSARPTTAWKGLRGVDGQDVTVFPRGEDEDPAMKKRKHDDISGGPEDGSAKE